MNWFKTADELEPILRRGEIDACSKRVAEILDGLPQSPFHVAPSLDFDNDPIETARYFDEFIQEQSRAFDLKAVYTETNGFSINPDRWFFDAFSYDSYGGLSDFDWLSDMKGETTQNSTLTGMEDLQAVFASPAFSDPQFSEASDYAGLYVVTRFQALIMRSIPHIKNLKCPLLATAHDYDFISCFKPGDS